MRVYEESRYGLGVVELNGLRQLSGNSRSLISEELQEPESRETILWILRQDDPERALANAITENIQQASAAAADGSGLGDGLGKSFFKKLKKLHSRIVHAVVKIHKKIDPGLRAVTRKKSPKKTAAPAAPVPQSQVQTNPPAYTPNTGENVYPTDAYRNIQPLPAVNYIQEPSPAASAPADQATEIKPPIETTPVAEVAVPVEIPTVTPVTTSAAPSSSSTGLLLTIAAVGVALASSARGKSR